MTLFLRVTRGVVVVLLGYALYSALVFVSIGAFSNYTTVGNDIGLAAIMLFAVWAWWYGEDRDRRRALEAAHDWPPPPVDGDGC